MCHFIVITIWTLERVIGKTSLSNPEFKTRKCQPLRGNNASSTCYSLFKDSAFSPGHVVWNERIIDKYWSICNFRYCPVTYLEILTETTKHPLRITMTWPKF